MQKVKIIVKFYYSSVIANLEKQRCWKKCQNGWLENGKHSSKPVDISLGNIKRPFVQKGFPSMRLQHCHYGILFQSGLFEFDFLNEIYLSSTLPDISGVFTIHALLRFFMFALLSSKECRIE